MVEIEIKNLTSRERTETNLVISESVEILFEPKNMKVFVTTVTRAMQNKGISTLEVTNANTATC